jgi:hypothetical protein
MKVYLDLDGVICNFEKRYIELFRETPGGSRDRKEFSVNWCKFVESKQFESLDWWPGGQQLLDYIGKKNVEVEILTSSGGQKYHSEVEQQKIKWLCNKGITYKANVVPGRSKKSEYATPDSILIDDTEDVIKAFRAAGGIGIHHKDIGNTLALLDIYLTQA